MHLKQPREATDRRPFAAVWSIHVSVMTYTVMITESLEGICISSNSSKYNDVFTVTEIFTQSKAATFGISIGDIIQRINDQPFSDIVSECQHTDPNCILWDIETPFMLTVSKNANVTSILMNEISESDEYQDIGARHCESKEQISDIDMDSVRMDTDQITTDPATVDMEVMELDDHTTRSKMYIYRHPFGRKSIPPTEPMRTLMPTHSPFGSTSLSMSTTPTVSTTISSSIFTSVSSEMSDSESAPSPRMLSPSNSRISLIDISGQLLRRHISQRYSLNPFVHFDTASITKSNGKVIALSSRPLQCELHEWCLEIMKIDVEMLEIGVCSVCDIEGININDGGVTETAALGARAVYGSELATDSVWYSSINENGARRCFKDLTPSHQIGWTAKDQIRVVVDLNKFRIKFFLNGRKVSDKVVDD